MHPTYQVYEVGFHCSRWDIEDSEGYIAFSTNDNYVYRGESDDGDHIATIAEDDPKHWSITMLDTHKVINVRPVDGHFDFEYHRVKYRWIKEAKRNWNLTIWKGPTVAEFNKVELSLTKIGDIFIMGDIAPEIVIVTIKAIEMAHERYGWKCTEL